MRRQGGRRTRASEDENGIVLDLDHVTLDISCPRCGYGVEIQLLDARTQVWRWCPCCRVRIRMVEPDGSVSGAVTAAEAAMNSLAETLRRMSR